MYNEVKEHFFRKFVCDDYKGILFDKINFIMFKLVILTNYGQISSTGRPLVILIRYCHAF